MPNSSTVSWQRLPIVELCKQHVDCVNRTAPVVDCVTPYKMIRTTNVRKGFIDTENVRYVTEDTYKRWTRRLVPRRGDVILTREAPLGDAGMLRTDESIFLGQRLYHFRPDPNKLDAHFLLYALMAPDLQGQIKAFGSGSTVEHMRLGDIPELEITVPPTCVQRRIAGILSAYDELIENNQRRIKILEEMARSLYHEWFVNFRFPGHEKVPLVDSPLGPIPKGWKMRPVYTFGNVITGKTPSKANPNFYSEDIPFVKTPDMHGNIFILSTGEHLSTQGAESQSNKTIPSGALCVSCIGTIGVVSITTEDCQTNQQINSVVLSEEESREFLYLRFQDSKQTLQNLGANGATMSNVNKAKFESMELLTPSNDLLKEYHQHVSPMFAKILNLSRRNENLRRTEPVNEMRHVRLSN